MRRSVFYFVIFFLVYAESKGADQLRRTAQLVGAFKFALYIPQRHCFLNLNYQAVQPVWYRT